MRFSVGLVLFAVGGAIIGAVAMFFYSEVSRSSEPIARQSEVPSSSSAATAIAPATPTSTPRSVLTPTAISALVPSEELGSPLPPQIPFPSPVGQRTFEPGERPTVPSTQDFDALRAASFLLRSNEETYHTIAGLPWVRDGVSRIASGPAQSLIDLALVDSDAARELLRMSWLADEISEDEAWATVSLVYLALDVPETFQRLITIPWITDGIDEDEAWAIGSLSDVATESQYAVERLVSYPWFTDGILPDEATVVTALGSMSYELGAGAEFIGMSFLESIEPSDAIALMSLEFLSYDSPAAFRRVMSHPSVVDGITDDETATLALLSDVQITNPDMMDTLLEQSNVQIERRSIELPLAGDVELAIVRLQPGAARSMGLLESAVRFTEDFMGEPLPTNFLLLFYADAVVSDYAGHNSGLSMTVHPDFDSDDDSDEASYAPYILAHEVAHYYWNNSSQLWLDEGAAEIVSIVYEETTTGQEAMGGANTYLCAYAADLTGVEQLEETLAGDCAYSLGTRFFLDLYRSLGEEEYQRGFRDLYLMGVDILDPEDPDARGIDHVREAFGFSQEARDEIIPKWYWESP